MNKIQKKQFRSETEFNEFFLPHRVERHKMYETEPDFFKELSKKIIKQLKT